jgi:hypothetical protein
MINFRKNIKKKYLTKITKRNIQFKQIQHPTKVMNKKYKNKLFFHIQYVRR